jgi:GT2 family glycosyltransferase
LNAFLQVLSCPELSISVIIPVHNGGESFRRCLLSVIQAKLPQTEVIVVADGVSDHSEQFAKTLNDIVVIQTPETRGPAYVRNVGAKVAQGDLLFFVDADVEIRPNTLAMVKTAFQRDASLDALIGSYDDAPGEPNFLSQYKNLFHHYVHQTAQEDASTFWGACGAIKRQVFLKIGGFDERYRYPSVEDIELGYRLKANGYKIQLCKTLQVKHLKHWRPVSLLRAEFFYRALPWTELLLRDRSLRNDLNLQWSSRLSVLLVYGLVCTVIAGAWWPQVWWLTSAMVLLLLGLNLPVYQFFQHKRGFLFVLRVIPWHWLYYLYSGLAFAIGLGRYGLSPSDFSHASVRVTNEASHNS